MNTMGMFDDILKVGRRTSASAEQYGLWGREAAKRHLEDGVPLETSVRKIASENNLNSEEVRRVSESANLDTYADKLKTASGGNKSFEFELVDPRKITSPEPEKTAGLPVELASDYEYRLDDDLSKTAGVDLFELFGVSEGIDKVAIPKLAFDLLERLECVGQQLRDKLAFNMEKSVENANDFYHEIKQEFLTNGDFDEVSKAVKAKAEGSKFQDRIIELLGWAKRRLVDEGILQNPSRTGDSGSDATKTAEPVEAHLITDAFESPGVPVAIINGRHPIFALIDTLVPQFEEADESRKGLLVIDDKIRYVKNRVYKNQ
jgi:hypothetical protein